MGQHHRKNFLDSANTIILAAAAALRTSRIKLTFCGNLYLSAAILFFGYSQEFADS